MGLFQYPFGILKLSLLIADIKIAKVKKTKNVLTLIKNTNWISQWLERQEVLLRKSKTLSLLLLLQLP